jgi:rhodanese-related sulfurtransferase
MNVGVNHACPDAERARRLLRHLHRSRDVVNQAAHLERMRRMTMPKTAAELVAEAKANVENLTPDQVAQEIEQGAVLIDLREPNELTENGKIPGAVHAPRGMLEFYADPSSAYHRAEFDPGKRVILHCASGGRSALAAGMLKQLGYENVAHMDGGINAWKAAGKPTE